MLLEWESSGIPPVGREKSTARALRCTQCAMNKKGDLLAFFTQPVADMFKRKFQRLHELKLNTPHDPALNVCEACLCPLKLKVHAPLVLILKHLKPEARARLWQHCWITAEESAGK